MEKKKYSPIKVLKFMAHVGQGRDGGKGKHIYFPSLIENIFDRSSDTLVF